MAEAAARRFYPLLFLSTFFLIFQFTYSVTFTISNKCTYTVWPGILSNAGTSQLPITGFALQPGDSNSFYVPPSWSGRLWGRTLCTQDPTTDKFSCLTADCGSSTIQCSGNGAATPATLAEFTLNGANGLDFYDVSLVDGYNLPMLIAPAAGNCTVTGCAAELNNACPSELKVVVENGKGDSVDVACKSACDAFRDPKYCCSGEYSNPNTCSPSSYSEYFKNACPRAYSYAYDDGTSTFTCASGADYLITFCPSPSSTSLKSANGQNPNPEAVQVSGGTRSHRTSSTSNVIAGAFLTAALSGVCQLLFL